MDNSPTVVPPIVALEMARVTIKDSIKSVQEKTSLSAFLLKSVLSECLLDLEKEAYTELTQAYLYDNKRGEEDNVDS